MRWGGLEEEVGGIKAKQKKVIAMMIVLRGLSL